LKKAKVFPFPRKKRTPKKPEFKVLEFSGILKEVSERHSRASNDRKKEDRSEEDDE
jgi:hypothetical protein